MRAWIMAAMLVVLLAAAAWAVPGVRVRGLICDPPTTNTDGTPLTDLAGYTWYWGASSGAYTSSTNTTAPGVAVLLPAGVVYLAVTARNSSGDESDYSDELVVTNKVPDKPVRLQRQ